MWRKFLEYNAKLQNLQQMEQQALGQHPQGFLTAVGGGWASEQDRGADRGGSSQS